MVDRRTVEYFFEQHGDKHPMTHDYPECGAGDPGSIEELYQMFKARLILEAYDAQFEDGD